MSDGGLLGALALPFIQRALAAGVLVGATASYYGVFVVQRRLAFLGDGLAHAALGGVALALLLGREPLWIAVPFTVVVALGITWVTERTKLGADTAIGVFFALSMALGIIFLSLKQGYAADAIAYLFGSILAVSRADLWAAGAVALLTLAASALWGRWAYATFDRECALADRVPVRFDDYLLSVLIAVAIVVAAKVVGIVLLSSFLIIPAAAARLVSRSFAIMTVLAVACGVLSVIGGLAASYTLNLPSGATVILTQTAVFLLALALSSIKRRASVSTGCANSTQL
jgi:zinc transport system permease protein